METVLRPYQKLSGSALKILAVFTMLIDHIGATILVVIPNVNRLTENEQALVNTLYTVCRSIGRTAFPLFCFLLVEGVLYTHSRLRYAIRLFLFAFLSEVPFDLCFRGVLMDLSYQNVFFTLAIGMVTIWGLDAVVHNEVLTDMASEKIGLLVKGLAVLGVLSAGCLVAYFTKSDYGASGVLLIAILYLFHNNRVNAGLLGLVLFIDSPFAALGFLAMQTYNGKRGLSLKYVFYLFYPVHLLMLYGIWRCFL